MKLEDSLLKKCLKNLQALPNIETIQKHDLLDGSQKVDGLLTIRSPIKSADYAYTIQPNITFNTTKLVISYFKLLREKLKHKLILITSYLSDSTIEQLLNENIEFIDSLGNIYLDSSAAYILIRGKHHSKTKRSSPSQITPVSLKIIYILLANPGILAFPFEKLAEAAETTLVTINNSLQNLYKLGYLMRQPGGGYRIANYIKLLERWEIGYVETLRPKLLIESYTFTKDCRFSEVAKKIIQLAKEEQFLIGGELGAALATSYLIPQNATLHVKDNYRAIAAKLKLKPSTEGEIIFLQQFSLYNIGDYNQDESLANPLLIHAELLIENNDRLRETAKHIFIKFIQNQYQNA